MAIFANGLAAFVITDRDSFSQEDVSRSISRVCIGIVIEDKLCNGTIDINAAKVMAQFAEKGIVPKKKYDKEKGD